ncbi:MAG: DNA recombination protein RmuC [Candidatus Paceibacterota bacterium]|jgi:DNA recombination protein RmuC
MSDTLLIILTVLVAILIGAVIFLIMKFNSRAGANEEAETNGMKLLLQQVNELSRTVDAKIGEGTRQMNDSVKMQLSESRNVTGQFLKELSNIADKVARVEETGKNMVTFADQLQSLQDILKNPKQRGILGEYYLETLLKNVLPPGNYQMQYAFKNGEIVDAIVRVKDKIIPVDSKFSLENYNRLVEERNPAEKEKLEKIFVNDLKNRIVETSKYIRPGEGTMDFAFMFIPHEAIYYDLLINKIGALADDTENLIQRAAGKYKVIIVSPTSFLAYLQTVLQGLKAMQIEEQAKEIVKNVDGLMKHLKSYDEYHNKLGNALSTAVNQYNISGKEFKKIDKDILKITGVSAKIEPALLAKPESDELEG